MSDSPEKVTSKSSNRLDS